MLRPTSLTGVIEAFGDIRTYILPDGTIRPEWELHRLATVELPPGRSLKLSWKDPAGKQIEITRIRCHVRLVEHFGAAFRNVAAAGLWSELKEFGGCYAFRVQRGDTRKISLHAWGIAVDLNPTTNPRGESDGDMHPGVIQSFEAAGFYWGGRFSTVVDQMHFQFAEGC